MQPIDYQGFLESELSKTNPETSLFHVIPAGLEQSVSYGKGTSMGPAAILAASQQLELYDGKSNPAKRGIYTHSHLPCTGTADEVITLIDSSISELLVNQKIPVLLGGEHTVSVGAFQALKKTGKQVGIVQFDAHADLRNTYEGSPFSHACTLRRAFDLDLSIFQIGIRSLSPDEVVFRKEKNIAHLDASEIALTGIPEILLPDDFPESIYITFDVDGLDPTLIPATGTPEPGGLTWYDTMALLEKVINGRNVLGFDTVELAPIKCLHSCDFAVARLIYNIMGMIDRNLQTYPA